MSQPKMAAVDRMIKTTAVTRVISLEEFPKVFQLEVTVDEKTNH